MLNMQTVKLRVARLVEQGETQYAIAERGRFSKSQWSNLLNGHQSADVRLSTLDALAKALRVPAWLLLLPSQQTDFFFRDLVQQQPGEDFTDVGMEVVNLSPAAAMLRLDDYREIAKEHPGTGYEFWVQVEAGGTLIEKVYGVFPASGGGFNRGRRR